MMFDLVVGVRMRNAERLPLAAASSSRAAAERNDALSPDDFGDQFAVPRRRATRASSRGCARRGSRSCAHVAEPHDGDGARQRVGAEPGVRRADAPLQDRNGVFTASATPIVGRQRGAATTSTGVSASTTRRPWESHMQSRRPSRTRRSARRRRPIWPRATTRRSPPAAQPGMGADGRHPLDQRCTPDADHATSTPYVGRARAVTVSRRPQYTQILVGGPSRDARQQRRVRRERARRARWCWAWRPSRRRPGLHGDQRRRSLR